MLCKSLEEIDSMEADEVRGWQCYMQMEPRGETRRDYNAAQVTQALYTIMNALSQNPKPVNLETCLLKFEEVPEKQKSDTYKNAIKVMGLFGGTIAKQIRDDIKKHFPGEADD
jgi:hypothetical protein